MRFGFRCLMAATVLSIMGSGMVRADVLDPTMLPSNTKWFMHLDMDAILKSDAISGPVNNFIQEHHIGQHPGGHHGGILSNIHLPEDLHDITMFGASYEDNAGITLIRIAAQPQSIEQMLENRPGVQTISYGENKIFSFHGDVFETSPKPTELLIAHSLDALKQELDVLAGKNASLPADSGLLTDNTSGLFFYASGSGLNQLGEKHAARSPILSHIEDGWLACTQKGTDLTITGQLTALTEQSATEIQESLQGMAATTELSLEANSDGSQMQPASGNDLDVSITVNGREVQINCTATPNFWLKMLPGPPGPNRGHGPGSGPDGGHGPGPGN